MIILCLWPNVPNKEEIFHIWHVWYIGSQLRIRNNLRLQIGLHWTSIGKGNESVPAILLNVLVTVQNREPMAQKVKLPFWNGLLGLWKVFCFQYFTWPMLLVSCLLIGNYIKHLISIRYRLHDCDHTKNFKINFCTLKRPGKKWSDILTW